jgi:hypothetical protein
VAILFAAWGIGVWGLDAPQYDRVAEAAAPSAMRFNLPTGQQEQGGQVRRESILPSQSGPSPLAGPASLFQPLLTPIFGENYRANTDTQSPNLAQQEPSIAINPTNLLNVVAAAKDERAGSNTKQVWIYTSTDGGVTWLNQIFPFAPTSPYSSDPVVNFSDDGICYVTSLPYGGGAADGIQVARSTNGGITFSPGVHLPGTNNSTDKEWTWVDNFPSSPYYHRIYTAYMDFGSGSVWRLNYSSDRGVTWSQPSAPVSAYQFPMPVVLPNGHVLVTYLAAADALAYARSTNGGVSFSGPQIIRGIIRPYCPPDNAGCSIWRLSAIPATGVSPINGSIVIVWADGNGNRATTYYTRSTDNGVTWSPSAPLAVSPVPGTYQVEPWVEADERGTFHSIWYDNRENPNTSIFHIYYSQSTDSGATWSNAVRISTATSDLRIGIPSSYNRAAGDYIQVTAWGGNVYAAWTDTRSGTGEDIYVVRGVQPITSTVTPMPTTPGTFVPTSTMTRTAVPTRTATTVSTAPPTSTPTRTVLVTATSGCCPTPTAVGTTSCPAPDNYDYTFSIGNSCWRPQFGSTRFYFQAAPDQSGPWDTLDETQDQPITLPPGSTGVNGRFVETAVPTQYQIYRVRMRLITGNCTTITQDFYTDPSPLCRAPVSTSTPTPTTTSVTTSTPTAMITSVTTSTPTATGTNIVASTPTACAITFTDVPVGHTFYANVRCLACRGIVSGYADGTFRPDNLVTRGQLAKIVSNAANFTEPPGAQIFQDVAPDNTFYEWINRLTNRGYMTGYTCGSPGEPCVNNRPYFRPHANATRGQTSKIVANAAMIETNIPPTQQTFEDVPPTQTFWLWIERLATRGVMGGYSCGGPGEPCVLPARRAYFRPNNDVTRGQSAKIVSNTFLPTCAP